MLVLRCKHCGAPLDKEQVTSDSAYVTCGSCGTSQQRVDAKAYLDQMMGQIQSWISKSLPGGFSLSQSENVDSVARFNIFNTSIKPKIETEYTEYRFAVNTLLSNALMVLPFSTDASVVPSNTSTQAFEFNARSKSIYPLAVDDASKTIVRSAENMGTAYAMLINNIKLLQEDKPGRFVLMSNNFKEASEAFAKVKGYDFAVKRFASLSQMCQGCEKLLNGDAMSAYPVFNKVKTDLDDLKNKVLTDLDLGIMYQGIDMESSQASVLGELSGFVTSGIADNPMEILDIIRRIFARSFNNVGEWSYYLNNKDRYNEIFSQLSAVLRAKGSGTLPITAGSGQYLIPFWDVDLTYSFQTGAMWKKKSVEVTEDLLIPADFVIDNDCLKDPSLAITDIFALRPAKSILDGIAGNETSISGGQGISKMSMYAQNSVGSRKTVVPLSTKKEAEKLVTNYLNQRTASESQLKLSKPTIKGLLYIPCEIDGDVVKVPSEFGALVPKRIMRTKRSELIIV